MNGQTIFIVVSFVTAGLVFLLGLWMLLGVGIPPAVATNFRIMLGTAMVLYGAYRLFTLCMKQRHEHEVEE